MEVFWANGILLWCNDRFAKLIIMLVVYYGQRQ